MVEHRLLAFFKGAEFQVQRQWKNIEEWAQQDLHPSFQAMASVVAAARRHPQLALLYPFTSLFSLQFSRCTAYPFDCPCSGICASIRDEQIRYLVVSPGINRKIEFEGDCDEAIAFIAAQLPADIGPARLGTADLSVP